MISISYVMCMIYVTMLFVSVAHGPVGLLRNKVLTYLLTYICRKQKDMGFNDTVDSFDIEGKVYLGSCKAVWIM